MYGGHGPGKLPDGQIFIAVRTRTFSPYGPFPFLGHARARSSLRSRTASEEKLFALLFKSTNWHPIGYVAALLA